MIRDLPVRRRSTRPPANVVPGVGDTVRVVYSLGVVPYTVTRVRKTGGVEAEGYPTWWPAGTKSTLSLRYRNKTQRWYVVGHPTLRVQTGKEVRRG